LSSKPSSQAATQAPHPIHLSLSTFAMFIFPPY
jgi:hypothetical protein